jgi:dihydrofolate synthase/folylpolyglutamate synthase
MKLGLESIRALLRALGDPQNAQPAVLIAGTNGKGSVAAYVAAAVRAAGVRAGLYTSPHLIRVNERIAVDGLPIDDAALDGVIGAVRDAAEALVASGALSDHPTYFEVLTTAALLHFRRREVGLAILEVGLGGRLDATNVVDPVASAIVTVGRDHEAMLGTELARIAAEKAGVLRSGRATVVGSLPASARVAVEERAVQVGARVVDALRDTRVEESGSGYRIATPLFTYEGVCPLPGEHQLQNAVVALRLLEVTAQAGVPIDLPRAGSGVSKARWPGRIQRIAGSPELLLDGAHNPDAARALAAHLAQAAPDHVLLFGAMRDKDVPAMARQLFPGAREVVLCGLQNPRAASATEIARRSDWPTATLAADAGAGLARARELAGPGGVVVVAGSLYLVGEVMELVGAEPWAPA